jgi:hypothetical protein
MDYDRLLTELQETGRCSLHGVTSLGEIVYLCDTLGLDLKEMRVTAGMAQIDLVIRRDNG